jgi:hypothetical protein
VRNVRQERDRIVQIANEVAGGDIAVWVEEFGAIVLKVREPSGNPIELGGMRQKICV